MITKLTEQQQAKFPEYVKTWTAKGLTTQQRTPADAIRDFSEFQRLVLQKKEIAPVVILNSPMECWVAVQMVKRLFGSSQVESQVWSQVESQVESQVRSKVESQVRSQVQSQVGSQVQSQVGSQVVSKVRSQVDSQVRSQVRSQVWSQVDSQVRSQVESQVVSKVRSQVDSQVWSQVHSQVVSQVRSQVGSQVWSQVESQVRSQVQSQVQSQAEDFVWPYFDCQFWVSWFSYYEFMKSELGVIFPNNTEYEAFKACQGYGMVFPLDELCIVCQPPSQIHKNANGLHNENGSAVSYGGENEIYALNGVIMTKDYVMTSAHEISSETILKESNAEVRRELIRKVGIEKMLTSLPHKLLEKRGNYELYSLNLSDEVKDARYLKMTNPSIGVFHLEGVAPEILTIDAALNWRNQNMFTDAEVLT